MQCGNSRLTFWEISICLNFTSLTRNDEKSNFWPWKWGWLVHKFNLYTNKNGKALSNAGWQNFQQWLDKGVISFLNHIYIYVVLYKISFSLVVQNFTSGDHFKVFWSPGINVKWGCVWSPVFVIKYNFNWSLVTSFSFCLEKKMDAFFCNSQRNDPLPPQGKSGQF